MFPSTSIFDKRAILLTIKSLSIETVPLTSNSYTGVLFIPILLLLSIIKKLLSALLVSKILCVTSLCNILKEGPSP